jgi:DNA topoisomerase-1
MGEEFTARDFRTWAGTVLAAVALRDCPACATPAQRRRRVVAAVQAVASRLGNTHAVCRRCYVHPAVIDAYLAGTLPEALPQAVTEAGDTLAHDLAGAEASVLAFLQGRRLSLDEEAP